MSFTSTSTASLVSNTSVSLRTPLTRPAPQKDYQAAFGNLQSTYGFGGSGLYYGVGGSALSPVPKQIKSTSSKRAKRSPTAPATDVSLKVTKNFQAAFGNLQSTFGFGGAAPSPIPKKQ
ncbi:hypothetical protein DFH06DRAFT_1426346 [Mycena polygramma]|nr:hypothetical protein DFH06DRAFT_1426346 [Mycena polygramma]